HQPHDGDECRRNNRGQGLDRRAGKASGSLSSVRLGAGAYTLIALIRVLTARVSEATLADRERILRHADPDTDTRGATAAPASSPPRRSVLRVIFIVLGVALVLWLLHALKGILLLVVLAVFFAYLVSPLVDLCRRPIQVRGRPREVPRGLAIVIVYLVLFASFGTAAYLLLPRLGSQTAQFAQQATAYLARVRERVHQWSGVINPERFPRAVRET